MALQKTGFRGVVMTLALAVFLSFIFVSTLTSAEEKKEEKTVAKGDNLVKSGTTVKWPDNTVGGKYAFYTCKDDAKKFATDCTGNDVEIATTKVCDAAWYKGFKSVYDNDQTSKVGDLEIFKKDKDIVYGLMSVGIVGGLTDVARVYCSSTVRNAAIGGVGLALISLVSLIL